MIKKLKDIIFNNFLLIFCIYYFTIFLDATSLEIDYPVIELISKIIRYAMYLLFFIRLIFVLPYYKEDIKEKKWKQKTLLVKITYVILFILVISLILNFIITKNKRMIFLILVLLSAYKMDYKKIIKATMNLQIILTSILVLLSILGITQNYIVPRGNVSRYSFGFLYTTNLAQMIAFSSILYLYINGSNIKYRELFIIQIMNVFTYFITDSRTEFIMLEFIVLIMFIWKFIQNTNKGNIVKKLQKLYSSIFTKTFILYPILSFIIVMCYPNGGIWNNVNSALSNRLKQTYDNIATYGVQPFGDNVELLGLGLKEKIKYGNYKSNYIDNEYIQMMFREGSVFTVCFILLINILLIVLYKKGKYKEIMLCSIYLLFGLLNPRIVNILYCPILFMFIPEILNYKKINEKKHEEILIKKEGTNYGNKISN